MHNNVNQMLSINEKNKQEILYPMRMKNSRIILMLKNLQHAQATQY